MSGNYPDLTLAMIARVQINRRQQGYGLQISEVGPNNTLTLLGTIQYEGDCSWISEWMAQGKVLQIQMVTLPDITPLPPPGYWEPPRSIDGG